MSGWKIQGCRDGWMVMTESGIYFCWFKALPAATEFIKKGGENGTRNGC